MPSSYISDLPVLVCVYLCSLIHCSTEINISLQDTTAFLNMTGMFSCNASGGDYIVWRVNGTSHQRLPSDVQNDIDINPVGILASGLSTLTITAKAVYNGTTVQCVTGIGAVVVESGNVTLTIQGIYYNLHNKYAT